MQILSIIVTKIGSKKIILKKIFLILLLSGGIICGSYFSYNTKIISQLGDIIDNEFIYKKMYFVNNHKNKIAIITIDNKTLDRFQNGDVKTSHISKKTFAQLTEILFEKYKISTLGYDIIFANTDTKESQQILKNTLEKYKKNIVLATRGDNKVVPLCDFKDIQHGAVNFPASNQIKKVKISFPEYSVPCKENNVRKKTVSIYTFAIEVYKQYITKNKISFAKKHKILQKNLMQQTKENNGYMFINYFTNGDKIKTIFGFENYSMIDILEGKNIDLERKIILVGEAGTLFHDSHKVPISLQKKMPGVEIHANVIQTMLSHNYLTKISKFYIILLTIITTVIGLIIVWKFSIKINIILFGIIMFGIFICSLQLFDNGIIYPFGYHVYVLFFVFIIGYIYKYFSSEKNKIFLKGAFGKYISPDMVDILIKNPEKLNLQGEAGYITTFFSDIVGFTTISEKMKSKDLFAFLNEYLSEMTQILVDNKGTLDKYIGDAVMGFFNAPLSVEDHEFLGCKTAIEQQDALKKMNIQWAKRGLPELKIRIGIHSGTVVHGNLGGADRINYTIIGDSVNLASRLEAINKIYGTEIIISGSTYNAVKGQFFTRELDTIQVKGKTKGVKIFELISYNNKNISETQKNIYTTYQQALKYYYEENYTSALKYFEKNGDDYASNMMKERCENIVSGKVVVKNGTFVMTTK